MDNELFELCKEVYKRTEWAETDQFFMKHAVKDPPYSIVNEGEFYNFGNPKFGKSDVPLYTSDYLLEKLPPVILDPDDKIFKHIQMWINGDKHTHAGYVEPYAHDDKVAYAQKSDEMRKTLMKLVIALDDAGELK